jgi:hypothetical protein
MAGLVCAWPLLLNAQTNPTHEHGNARLNLDQEADSLMLELEVPAGDLVGFEHLPTTDDERAKVAKVAEALSDYHNVVSLVGAQGDLQCEQAYGEIESPLMEREPETTTEEEQDEHEDEEEMHADFFVNYELQCPGMPRGLKAALISNYQGLVALHFKWELDAAGEGEKVLTPSELQVSF